MFKIVILLALLLPSAKIKSQIQGDVLDPKEKGVPNALVIITGPLNKADTVKTDSRGFYELKGLKPGKYKIEVIAGGFKTFLIKDVEVKEGETGRVEGESDLYRGQRLDIELELSGPPKTG